MKKTFLLISLSALSLVVSSQEVIATAGNYFEISQSKLEWTIGDFTVSTLTVGSNIITQGFHQPRLTVTAITPTELELLTVSVYPNPTSDILKIDAQMDSFSGISYQLYNIKGMLIKSEMIQHSVTELNLTSYTPGVYLLKVLDSKRIIGTYRIVKQ